MLLIFVFLIFLCGNLSPGFAQTETQPDWCKQQPRSAYRDLARVEITDEWFEVYRIRPGIFALYEPRQYEEVISYLITGTDRALLFDTGMGIGNLRKLVTQLTTVPILVLNSHTHPDHIGANADFQQILAVDTVFTHENSRGYSDPEMRGWVRPDHLCGPLPAGFDPESYAIRPFLISRYVKDGELIDLGGRTIEVLLTPGHTPDSLMLLERKERLLFTGDSFYPGPIYLYSPGTDFNAYVRSMTRVEKLSGQLDLLLPAHNVPVASPKFLTEVVAAANKILSGAAPAKSEKGKQEYVFNGFSLILAASARAEKRDPFVQMKGDRTSSSRSSSALPATFTVGFAVVRGITKRGSEYIALIKAADGKMYSMKVGDRLRDGKILKIDSDAVTFLHNSGRKVRKELHPAGE